MKITFHYSKQLNQIFVTTENCTFEFITESYHKFQTIAKDMTLNEKQNLKLTFEKTVTNG